MKLDFSLKLAIGIVAVFGMLLIGMALYWPLWYRIQGNRLESDNPATRESAIDALADRGEYAIPHIRKWLGYSSIARVTGACLVLEEMEGNTWKAVLPKLEAILQGEPSDKIHAAASVLEKHEFPWKKQYKSSPSIITNMWFYHFIHDKDPSSETGSWKAAYKIGRIGGARALLIFGKVLRESKDEDVRSVAASMLEMIRGPVSAGILIEAVRKDQSTDVRMSALCSIREIGGPSLIEPLIEALQKDPDNDVREYIVEALGEIGDERAVGPLLKLLEKEQDFHFCRNVLDALGKIGSTSAVKPLVLQLESQYNIFAADALGEIGENRAVEPLLYMMENNPDNDARLAAARALGQIGDPRAVEPVIKLFNESVHPEIRGDVACVLGEIGDESATGPLLDALKNDKHPHIRGEAAKALALFDNADLIPLFSSVINSKNEAYVRGMVAKSLRFINNDKIIPVLIKTLKNDSNETVRAVAAMSLGWSRNEKAIGPLVCAMENDSHGYVQICSAAALMYFDKNEVKAALFKARKNNIGAAIALAFLNGGKDLDIAGRYGYEESDMHEILDSIDMSCELECQLIDNACAICTADFFRIISLVYARWGILYYSDIENNVFYPEIAERMPQGFPQADFRGPLKTRRKQIKAVKEWFRKNRHRLAWNEEERRYYLRD
jgi:HEAT repeat protein